MRKILSINIFLLLLCWNLPVRALPPDFDKKAAITTLQAELSRAAEASDSILVLSNMFDLCPRQYRDSIGTMVYDIALASGNSDYGLDALRNLGNIHQRNDSLLEIDIRRAMNFEPSDDRDETVALLRMFRNNAKVRYAAEEEKEREFYRILSKLGNTDSQDLYERIVLLHALCLYIADGSQGELLSKYLDRLGALIEQLRPEAYSLRNCYYVQASLAYAANREYEKSIENDRKLLSVIDALEDGLVGRNRRYRDYDGNRYIIYTRLLGNYQLLMPEEVEKYYSEAMRLVEEDELARSTNAISGCPQIYYAMYKHDYPKALELLGKYRDMPYNAPKKELLLKYTIESAEQVGDKDALLSASREYNKILQEVINQRSREKYKELQMVYDINGMKEAHAEQARILARNSLVWALVGAGVLLLLLVVAAILWRHARRLGKSLKESNEALRKESESLRESQEQLVKARDEACKASRMKSDFIKNISSEVTVPLHAINEYTNLIIDCSEAGYKPYLKHFSELVELNSELLTTMLNDVLSLSEIETNSLIVNRTKENLENLLELAADSVRHRLDSGVAIHVDKSGEEIGIKTDSRRLVQILVQLLVNAAKFTHEGSISVSYDINRVDNSVAIYVTDDGPGISPENSERIFERFVKLDHTSQGVGIGLTIARQLAQLLGGTLVLDTGYKGDGARFKLVLPLE